MVNADCDAVEGVIQATRSAMNMNAGDPARPYAPLPRLDAWCDARNVPMWHAKERFRRDWDKDEQDAQAG